MALKGIDFLISVGETGSEIVIGGQRGASLSRSADTLDVTNKDSGEWYEYLPSFKGWSIDFDALVVLDDEGYQALKNAYQNGEKVNVSIDATFPPLTEETGTEGTYKATGQAIITDLSDDYGYDAEATYSGTLQGTGPLTETYTPAT